MGEELISRKDAPSVSTRLDVPHSTRSTGSLCDHPALRMAPLAAAAGILAGFAAVALRWLLSSFQELFFAGVAPGLSLLNPSLVVLLPAVGALVAGVLVNSLAEEAKGAGVSHLLRTVLLDGSRMRPRVAGVKLVATALVLGSGGSAGVVGPMVQVGGALGSAVGQRLRLPEDRVRMLLASGAAAGVAAIVNAPLAGLFFAQEVILKEFSAGAFGLAALSAGIAALVARLALGDAPLLPISQYGAVHPAELPLYLLIGTAAAALGVAFTHGLDRFETVFSRLPLPACSKPAAGGFMVGIIGLLFPQVYGLGFETIGAALRGQLPLTLVAGLVVAKLAATCLTVGSGSSGGVIGPSLYLGAALGGTVGILLHTLLPGTVAASGAYALVGMAAVFSATFHAPITAVAIALELTGGYPLTLPLILACATSRFLALRLSPHAIYSLGLSRRGIDLQA